MDPPNVLFFAVAELGFRWCLAVSHAWRKSCVFGLSRLGCAIFWIYVSRYLRRGAFYYLFSQGVATYSLSLEGSKGAVSTPGGTLANGAFLAVLGPDLGGVWLFRIRSIFVLVALRL